MEEMRGEARDRTSKGGREVGAKREGEREGKGGRKGKRKAQIEGGANST